MQQQRQFEEACAKLCLGFFERFPNNDLCGKVSLSLTSLLKLKTDFPGAVGGWAGGIVYAVGCTAGAGVPNVLNAELEKAFGATMSTIRKRAGRVKQLLGLDASLPVEYVVPRKELTLRDEANAICIYACRHGPIERVHAAGRISEAEMKEIMVYASTKLAEVMAMKQQAPAKYEKLVRHFHAYCDKWER